MEDDFTDSLQETYLNSEKKSKEVWLEFKMPSGIPVVVKKLGIQHSVPICFNIMIIGWLLMEPQMIQRTMDEWEPKEKTIQKDENINERYVKKQ